MNTWWQGLADRERRFIALGGLAAALILLVMLVLPLGRRVDMLEGQVATKAADLAWMQGVAPQLNAAGPAVERPSTRESLVVLIDRSARESGLGDALGASEPAGDGGQRVQLESARFDTVVAWLARLREQHGVQVKSVTVDATGEPGLVKATLVLHAS